MEACTCKISSCGKAGITWRYKSPVGSVKQPSVGQPDICHLPGGFHCWSKLTCSLIAPALVFLLSTFVDMMLRCTHEQHLPQSSCGMCLCHANCSECYSLYPTHVSGAGSMHPQAPKPLLAAEKLFTSWYVWLPAENRVPLLAVAFNLESWGHG